MPIEHSPDDFYTLFEHERSRLVRLCAYFIGDADAAEDAAQDVFIEAWQHINELREPTAMRAWLSGIARNVCARWLRATVRQLPANIPINNLEEDHLSALDVDFEVELDRHELATLLARALALLPAPTREVLIQKYVADLPHAAIAEQLGLSENVVAVRLHRGKLALRKVLANQFQAELEPFGLVTQSNEWQESRIWCSNCGQSRLRGKFTEHEFVLRCPMCCVEPDSFHSQNSHMDILEGVKSFRPALNRFTLWMNNYFQTALRHGALPCRRCGQRMPLHLWMPAYAPPSVRVQRGLHVYCAHCDAGSYESLNGHVLNSPEGRRFFQVHKRIRALPQREITFHGAPAIVVAFECVTGEDTLRAVVHQTTYSVLAFDGGCND